MGHTGPGQGAHEGTIASGVRERACLADSEVMEATSLQLHRLLGWRRSRVRPGALLGAADVFMLTGSSMIAVLIAPAPGPHAYVWGLAYVITCLLVMYLRGFYEFRLGASIVSEIGRII